jgi:MoaA/NifB/PqqE/SkfB family radical SAM enzyme
VIGIIPANIGLIMPNKFDYHVIDEYQIEITSYCNAACPQCPRNNLGSGINPYMYLEHLPLSVLDDAFPTELVKRIRQIFFCGSYGDPIMHPHFLDICRMFRQKNPHVWIYIHTNGGFRKPEWWAELAQIINGYGKIDFGIDGLSDTNHLYRRNVNFETAINNARAFIDAGGKAQWNFIIFKHNEHQVEEARLLSNQYGFETFLPRKTGRFFRHDTITEMDSWPVKDKSGKHLYDLEVPTNADYRNSSMLNLANIKKDFPDITQYFNTTEIHCDALLGNKVAINAEGLVLPCNFFNHNLYDARFRDPLQLPGCNHLSFVDGKNQVEEIINEFGKDNLNIKNNSLEEIFENSFWNYVINSWKKDLKSGRIFECAMTCGKKLTKVWDQGGNKR